MKRFLLLLLLVPALFVTAQDAFLVSTLPDSVFKLMQGKSFPKDCTVARSDLRYITLLHYDLEGKVQKGELVCNKLIADDLADIFRQLYEARYPIGSVRLIDYFNADDELSMQANNTSCFCFRKVAGSTKLSKHAQGLAIDINPLFNPYKKGSLVQPHTARKYTDRTKKFPCKIDRNDLCYKLFVAHGFSWGGNWRSLKDYQHFER